MRILIIEDDPDSRESFCEVREAEGHDCVAVKSGRAAIGHLQTAAILPDAILLDMLVPEMDGWQFRREQTSDPRLSAIPVIVVTALPAAKNSALASRAAGFLVKPVVPEDLIAAFETLPRGEQPNRPNA